MKRFKYDSVAEAFTDVTDRDKLIWNTARILEKEPQSDDASYPPIPDGWEAIESYEPGCRLAFKGDAGWRNIGMTIIDEFPEYIKVRFIRRKEEDIPDHTPIPEGWYLLDECESLMNGDKVCNKSGEWVEAGCPGTIQEMGYRYIRKKPGEPVIAEREQLIERLAEKFCTWTLPESVCCDPCMIESDREFECTGTSLLTVEEAKLMVRHLLEDVLPAAAVEPERKVIQVPEGWRLLENDELSEEHDMFWGGDGWWNVLFLDQKIPAGSRNEVLYIRRKTEEKPDHPPVPKGWFLLEEGTVQYDDMSNFNDCNEWIPVAGSVGKSLSQKVFNGERQVYFIRRKADGKMVEYWLDKAQGHAQNGDDYEAFDGIIRAVREMWKGMEK